MKKLLLYTVVLISLFSCSEDEEPQTVNSVETRELTLIEIIEEIKNIVEREGNFDWLKQGVNFVFNASRFTDNVITVGYKSDDGSRKSPNSIKDELLQLVEESEGTNTLVNANETINVIDVVAKNRKTIEILKDNPNVRYIEPAGYNLDQLLNANATQDQDTEEEETNQPLGCTYKGIELAEEDYRTLEPGSKVSWHLDSHNIPEAWELSTGEGITVGVIDTGLSKQQRWMNEFFNDGFSQGRSIESFGMLSSGFIFLPGNADQINSFDGTNDGCGHGTSMAAIIGAPRNDDNLIVGIAYNANLVTFRASENAFITTFNEIRGVANSIIALADREDVKIISMSIGGPIKIDRIADAIQYAHKKGKLIFAAGGTSPIYRNFGVVFPASMEETIAATGVMEGEYASCEGCHKGSQIDFVVEVQRESGSIVPTLSYFDGQTNYTGSSSASAATMAGIAALVWSKYPNWTREQVIQRLKESAEFYPNKDENFGYGKVDAYKAVQ